MDGAVGRTVLRFDRFALDLGRGCLRDGQVEVPLRPKSFDLLSVLTLNAGRTVSKDELMDAVWPGVHVTEGSLFQCIRDVRRALGDEEQRLLRTVARRGYLLDAEVRREVELGGPAPLPPPFDEPRPAMTMAAMPEIPRPARIPRGIPSPWPGRRAAWLGAASVLLVAGVGMALVPWRGLVGRSPPPVAATPAASSQVAAAAAEGDALVVLPFANLSGDPSLDRFSNGVVEELLTELGRNPMLRIAARPLGCAQRDLGAGARRVARELGAAHVLEGGVRREADRVRITAQLVEAGTGRQIWAERYDVERRDSLALQEAVAARIAATLGAWRGVVWFVKGLHPATSAGSAGDPQCLPAPPGDAPAANSGPDGAGR